MRTFCLLGGFLLAISLVGYANDDPTALSVPEVRSSAPDSVDGTASLHRRPPRRQFLPDIEARSRDGNVCLMLRTYIVIRQDRDSDVTRRDGEVICQPAWRFQVRSADGHPQEP